VLGHLSNPLAVAPTGFARFVQGRQLAQAKEQQDAEQPRGHSGHHRRFPATEPKLDGERHKVPGKADDGTAAQKS